MYTDAVKAGATEDALLNILLDFQGHIDEDDLETMMFRIIYRIPLEAFDPQFIQENKAPKNFFSGDCFIGDCRVVEIPMWLWWYMEPSDTLGVCDGCNELPVTGLKQYLS